MSIVRSMWLWLSPFNTFTERNEINLTIGTYFGYKSMSYSTRTYVILLHKINKTRRMIQSGRKWVWYRWANEISSLAFLRSGLRNNSFNVNNFWLKLQHLINSSIIRLNFVLFLTPEFLPLLWQIDKVSDEKSDTLLNLNTTEEWSPVLVVLWIFPWGEHIIIFISDY